MAKRAMSLSAAAGGCMSTPAPTVTTCTPATGAAAGGTAITALAGTGFKYGAAVRFGGVLATGVVWVSPTELECITPAHAAGVVNVTVTNPDGQVGTGVGDYEYT